MSVTTLGVPEPLNSDHALEWFTCSEKRLENWLVKDARTFHHHGRSKTFVVNHPTDGGVVAYFTLSQEVIETKRSLPETLRGRVPAGYPKNAAVPAILLGKLALDDSLRNQGLGIDLLAEATIKAHEAAQIVGGVFLLVDPADGVEEFYAKAGFERVPDGKRMYQSLLEG